MSGDDPRADSSLRVAYLLNSYPAISQTFIRREIQALEHHGAQVTRIALRGWEEQLVDPADEEERGKTLYVLRLGVLRCVWAAAITAITRSHKFFQALKMAWRLGWKAARPFPYHLIYLVEACCALRWVKTCGVTHVHAHFATNSTEVVLLMRVLGGPPYSFTMHGPEEFDRPEALRLREKIRGAAFVAAISSYTRSQLYRWADFPDWPKIHIVRCGLEPEIFRITPAPSAAGVPELVCVGRLVEQKGQLLLVRAAEQLRARGMQFRLRIVGAGPFQEALEREIATSGLQEYVFLHGAAPGEEVYRLIRASRGLVVPSFAEGLPMVIMEAMALYRPIIATYIAGIPELVQDGETGFLVPAGSVEALVSAIVRLLEMSSEEAADMGAAGRERVAHQHAAATESEKLLALIRGTDSSAPSESSAQA